MLLPIVVSKAKPSWPPRGGIHPMKIKLLFWSAVLFFTLGLKTGESALFYFFSIHLFMLFIGVFLHKYTHKPQPQKSVEPRPAAAGSDKK
jgi:hypothetical protein